VSQEDQVTSPLWWIIQQTQKLDSRVGSRRSKSILKVARKAFSVEDLPVSRPLFPETGWRHHYDRTCTRLFSHDGDCHGHCDKCLPHTNFVSQNHARLSYESGEKLRSGTLLSLTILFRNTVIAQADLRVQHRFASKNAALT
jgi:hypothetical protein